MEGQRGKADASDSHPKDEYKGQYKDRAQTASEEQKFGMNAYPVDNGPTPYKGLRNVGG